ncbi:MAG: apolipoprotein N-acyltransferase, partial [Bacteroidota bacterium]
MSHQARRYLGFALLSLSVLIAGGMYWRFTRQELWGFAPLFMYLAAYGGILLLRTFRRDGSYRADNAYSVASGFLLGVGFPGLLPFPFLLLVAWVPLLLLYQRLRARGAGYGEVFRHALAATLLFNILTTYWVTNTAFAAGLFALVANSLLMTLPWLFFHWTSQRSPKVAILALVAGWIAFEYGHYHWELNWPWLTLGNGFAQFPSLIQWYEITGVLGGSAWIWGTNYLALRVYQGRKWWPLTLAVLLPLFGSLLRYFTYAAPEGKTITVATIQPNFEPHFEKFANNQNAQIDTFLRLSLAATEAGPVDYVVYPETSFGRIEENQPLNNAPMRILGAELRDRTGYLVTGFDGYYRFADDEPVSKAVRYIPRGDGSTVALEALNAVVQVDLQSQETQTYRKGVFVPGAESFPFRRVFFFLEEWVNSLGGTVAGRGTQERRLPLTSPQAKVAPVICYESVFGEYFTDYVREGAQAVFVMTNDGWWSNTA